MVQPMKDRPSKWSSPSSAFEVLIHPPEGHAPGSHEPGPMETDGSGRRLGAEGPRMNEEAGTELATGNSNANTKRKGLGPARRAKRHPAEAKRGWLPRAGLHLGAPRAAASPRAEAGVGPPSAIHSRRGGGLPQTR